MRPSRSRFPTPTDEEMDEYGALIEKFWTLDSPKAGSRPSRSLEQRVRFFLNQKDKKPHYDCTCCGKRNTIEEWVKWRVDTMTTTGQVSRWTGWQVRSLCIPEVGQTFATTECRTKSLQEVHRLAREERWGIPLEEKKQAIRDLREALGFEKAPTESTFYAHDLGKVNTAQFKKRNLHQMGRTIVPEGEWIPTKHAGRVVYHTTFLQVIQHLFPEEFAKVEIWNLRGDMMSPFVEYTHFKLSNGEPNYELVYPVIERFWELWSEHLGRTPTREDILGIKSIWFIPRSTGGEFSSDRYNKECGFAINLFPLSKKGITRLFYPGDGRTTRKGPYADEGGEISLLVKFMEDLVRFFLPNENPKIDLFEVLMAQYTPSMHVLSFWRDDELIRRWFKEIVLVGEGISPDGFPHDTPIEDIEKLYELSIRVLGCYPYARVISRVMKELYNIPLVSNTHHSIAVRHFLTNLWPEFDWNDVAMHRLRLEEKRVIHLLREIYGEEGVHVEKRLILCNGQPAKYKDTDKPHRMDCWIEKYNQPIDIQGAQHYMDYKQETTREVEGLFWSFLYKRSLDYRQDKDRRKARSWNGKTGMGVIYIPIAQEVCSVKGVHGDLPEWHRFATDDCHPGKGIKRQVGNPQFASLAQLFEMQGAVEIAQDIRNYYNGITMGAAI